MSNRKPSARPNKRTDVPGTIYLLHFESPISDKHTCQHYLGWAEDLAPRLHAHKHGVGARLTQVAKERGIGWTLVRTWHGTRAHERKLKNRHNTPKMCPICNERIASTVDVEFQS